MYLFSDARLFDVIEKQKKELAAKVEGIAPTKLLNADQGELCEALVSDYGLETPTLRLDDMFIHHYGEADVDARYEPNRFLLDRSEPFYVKGMELTVVVPFDGDPELFRCQPSHYRMSTCEADLRGNELRFSFRGTDLDAKSVRSKIDGAVQDIQFHLDAMRADLASLSADLRRIAEDAVNRRKQRLLTQQDVVANLGIPMRRRADAPTTYSPPVRRRRAAIERVAATETASRAEPALAANQYEEILNILGDMAQVMEKSPSAFADMSEESLRFLFLVPLNGQYEWDAAGEVFNFEGKTDILIRCEARNVFIAECKFWRGPASLTKAIDQILRYTTWRDTKTAVLLFNKKGEFSGVLAKIPAVVEEHPSFKRNEGCRSETHFRFVLARPDDPNREITLSILAFDVPGDEA